MDAKITKKRLNLLLSYDWIKIIALIVAVIVVWILVFTTAATRITPAQQFTIFNYSGTKTTSRFSNLSSTLENANAFSYDVLEVVMTDVTAGEDQAETLIQTRLMTNEGDALFASGVSKNESVKYTDDQGNEFSPTYLEQFLTLYNYYVTPIYGENGYLAKTENFLNDYYSNFRDENAKVDEKKAEEVFRARVKQQKDKRFKKESQIQQGIKDEIERIEKYRANLLKFEENVSLGYITVPETTIYLSDSNGNVVKKTDGYSINLCPDQRMANLKELVYYTVSETDEEGVSHDNIATANGINLVLLNTAGEQYDYSLFESLALVNYLVDRYCNAEAA